MQEQGFDNELGLLYELYNPKRESLKALESFLSKDCKTSVQKTTNFLRALNESPMPTINLTVWKKQMRMIRRTIKPLKKDELDCLFARYLLRGAERYFPCYIMPHNQDKFQEIMDMGSGLKFDLPAINKQKELMFFLRSQQSEEVQKQIVEVINTYILVDKKNQRFDTLHMNKFFAPFVVQNYKEILPQLERLLVRSSSNIEVWSDFFQSLAPVYNFEPYIIETLKGAKNQFFNYPEASISLVNCITSFIKDEKIFEQTLSWMVGMIAGQHQGKKKLVLVQMLKGLISSIKEFKHYQFSNQLMATFISSWAKFSEDEEYKILAEILDSLLPLIKQPSQALAEAFKPYLKSNNKTALVLCGISICQLFTTPEHFEINAVKDLFNHYKAQFANLLKKLDLNWQSIAPVITFMSSNDETYLEHIDEDLPVFQPAGLWMELVQKRFAIDLIIKIIKKALAEEEEIPAYLLISLTLILQSTKNRSLWDKMKNVPSEARLRMVSHVIYPSIWFKSPTQVFKNQETFKSLVRHLLHLEKFTVSLEREQAHRILTIAKHFNISLKLTDNIDSEIVNSSFNIALFNYEADEILFPNIRKQTLCQKSAIGELSINYTDRVHDTFRILLAEQNFSKNLDCLDGFEQELEDSIEAYDETMEKDKSVFEEQKFFNQQKSVKRKIFAKDTSIKMMSEDEAKKDKLNNHYLRMLYYYQKVLTFTLSACLDTRNMQILSEVWKTHFLNLIHAARHREHRVPLHNFIRKTCIEFYISAKKENRKEAHLFYKYSEFIADFFVMRGAKITPPVSIMQKCEKFLVYALTLDLSKFENGFIFLFFNDMCEYILDNMEFDINLKRLTVQFFNFCIEKKVAAWRPEHIFEWLVKNINILSSSDGIKPLLLFCAQKVDASQYGSLFEEILNFVLVTRRLILSVMVQIPAYKPEFEDYIKLRILALQTEDQIQELATTILAKDSTYASSITNFNMKKFIQNNSKETIQKLAQFIKECMTEELIKPIFGMVITCSLELYKEEFDEEGLEFFPYFLSLHMDSIREEHFRPIFDLLVMHYTANPEHATLSKLSLEIGIAIIKNYAPKYSNQILTVLESYINRVKGISNIIFLGVLAPFLQNSSNFQMVEKRVTDLFMDGDQSDQKAISKVMPDLMSFFKQPEIKIKNIFEEIPKMGQKQQIGQSYLATGLLKGIGACETLQYLDLLLSENYESKRREDKSGRLWLLNGFISNFGRVIETRAQLIIDIIISFAADSNQDIRDLAKKTGQILILKMSSHCVKGLLPHLLKGLENQQNWRIKISYIWILGIMANSSARQLQTSLSIIVPTLSSCLSNAHPTIKDKAAEALSLIGQTIKNPEISLSVEVLINALQDPFEKSTKAIDILLKTRFAHFIDPPSLSIIVPIVDYCLRGRSSDLKAGACQVMGSICELIQNPYDLLPYLKLITGGLKVVLCDPLPEIRSIAAMAIGAISAKVGEKSAEEYFRFVLDIIENPTSNTTEKHGAAQAYSEIICSQDFDYFEESLNRIFDKLNEAKRTQKEGFILLFLYVPGIRKTEFEGFIREVNQNMYGFVSDEDESIRNSALQVEKVLINNYGITHTDLLLEPLCDGVFESNWRKRNAALILIGEMMNMIKSHMYNTKTNDKNYAYYQGLMAVYVLKDDELEMPRLTANQVWNAYIENTPKTIKSGLKELVRMWCRFTHCANGIVFKNIVGFSGKYGENYFFEILEILEELIDDPIYRRGVFDVLSEFIKRLTQTFLSKDSYRQLIRMFYNKFIFSGSPEVCETLAKSMSLYVEKMHEENYFDELIYPEIDRMTTLSQEEPAYTYALHLIRDFLNTSSKTVVDRVINKIVEQPLSDFKIEVITNNASRIANKLYTLFKVPATNNLLQEILSIGSDKEQETRYKLIVYCLNQVSVHLSGKNKTSYINLLTDHIRKLTDVFRRGEEKEYERTAYVLETFLEMVLYFLGATPLDEVDDLQNLISDITILLKREGRINQIVHNIFLILVSDNQSVRTPLYYKQLVVAMENNLPDVVIWKDTEVFEGYLRNLVKGIAYGTTDVMTQGIKMIEFMMGKADRDIVTENMPRIMGPIIRVGNYPLAPSLKLDILNFVHDVFIMGHTAGMYSYQILSLCFRMLHELRNYPDISEKVAVCIADLLKNVSDKRNVINSILAKCKAGKSETLVQCFYYVIKEIINKSPELLSKGIYELIHEELSASLHNSEPKHCLKIQYYSSKTVARIGVYMGRKVVEYVGQLDAVTCSYQNMLHYLNFSHYAKTKVGKHPRLEMFIKDSSREKVFYLLKSLKLCLKNEHTREIYTLQYVQGLVPETLSGFDDIVEIMENFE